MAQHYASRRLFDHIANHERRVFAVQGFNNLTAIGLDGRGYVHPLCPPHPHWPVVVKTNSHSAQKRTTGGIDRSYQHRLSGLAFANACADVDLEHVAGHDIKRFVEGPSAPFIQFELGSAVKLVGTENIHSATPYTEDTFRLCAKPRCPAMVSAVLMNADFPCLDWTSTVVRHDKRQMTFARHHGVRAVRGALGDRRPGVRMDVSYDSEPLRVT